MNAFRGVPTSLPRQLAKWGDFEAYDAKPDFGPGLAYLKRIHESADSPASALAIDDMKLKVLMLLQFLFKTPAGDQSATWDPYQHIAWRAMRRNVVFDPSDWFTTFQPEAYNFVPNSILDKLLPLGRRAAICKAIVGP
jgi:hypothetical protein